MQAEDKLSSVWRRKETQNPEESLDHKYWKKIFIGACLCAVIVDPLFLYVPILKDDIKCLMLDPKLKIAVLLLRSFVDLFYLMDIIIRIYRSKNYSGLIVELNRRQHRMDFSFVLKSCVPRIVKTIWASNDILIDIVAFLPLPQMAILIFFSKMSDLRSLTTTRMVLMNVFVLLQYMPRVLRIYLSSMELKRTLEEEIVETPIWIKGVLNFYMYIIASHIIGAMWYFFAIQRMMICWHSACRKDIGCDNKIFGCHDHHLFRNTTNLNDLCPVNVSDNSSDTMLFDFGIYVTVLQYGVVGSTNYFQKFLNCFWWGLRNLSSLGSNLEPSVDGWENLYTILISITGLLLFLYLIGNLQMYLQFESTRTENRMQIKRKMKGKDEEIELWLFKKGIPTRLIKDLKLQIMEKVKQALQEDTYTNLDNILPLLHPDAQGRIKEPFAKLKQVPMLQGMDEGLLKIIYEKLEPVRYTENNFIIQKGESLKIIYIVDGFVSIQDRSSDDSRQGAGQLCGQGLLRWPSSTDFFLEEPLATESVKANDVVEALVLNTRDLRSMHMQFESTKTESRMQKKGKEIELWLFKNGIPTRLIKDIKWQIMEKVKQAVQEGTYTNLDNIIPLLPSDVQNSIKVQEPFAKLKQVPMLRGIDDYVLKIICQKLKPVRYNENSFIIQKGEILEKIVYIVDGFVSIEEGSSDDSRRGAGQLCGQELLRWPFSTYFLWQQMLATESVKAIGVVEALALNEQDLRSIYNQSDIEEKEKSRYKNMMKEEMKQNLDWWIRINGIPEKLNQQVKSSIMEKVEKLIQEDEVFYWDTLAFDWYDLVSRLPSDFLNKIKRYMPLTKLKEMPTFQNMDDKVLEEICSHLQPMKYNCTNNIIKKGDPIQMLLIVEGRIGQEGWVKEKDAGEIYGEELVVWPFSTSFPDKVPTAAESSFVITDVEALVLTASDMKSVATKFRKHFIKNYHILQWRVEEFPEELIKKATRNYTCLNYPNEGGYGTVYHTKLGRTAVAIKMCNNATGDPFIQSQRLVHEAIVLFQIRHTNVEGLLGCCLETRWPIMVYDRTNVLTLVEHFHRNKSKLSLESRMKIAAETAGALAHLHSMSVIHRDVKTANILIDQTTHTVKVTGFGDSRLLHEDEGKMEDEVSTLPGTSRYLDPEYLKSLDVYSFGVVLVELLTRQEAVSSNGSETSLANDFVCSVQEDRLGQILDGEINTNKFSFEMAEKVSELAVTCLRSRGEERPFMEKVAEELEGLVQSIINRVEHSTVDDNISLASRTSE